MVGEVHSIGEGKGHEAFMDAANHLAVYSGELSLVLGGLGDGVSGLADSIDDTWTEIWEDLAGIGVTIAFGFVTAGIADLVEGPLLIATGGSHRVGTQPVLGGGQGTGGPDRDPRRRTTCWTARPGRRWTRAPPTPSGTSGVSPGTASGTPGDRLRPTSRSTRPTTRRRPGRRRCSGRCCPARYGTVAAGLLNPNARAVRLLGRAGLRMTSSTAYTAADNLLAGRVDEPADALPTDPQWQQKEVSHLLGRTGVDIILGKGKGSH